MTGDRPPESENRAGVLRGHVDIGDKNYVLEILGTVGSRDPLRPIREFVENSLDAGATRIRVALRDGVLEVSDNGSGMSREKLESLPMSIGRSEKRILGMNTMGEKAIGLLSFGNYGDVLTIVSRAGPTGEPNTLKIYWGDKTYELLEKSGRIPWDTGTVVSVELRPEVWGMLKSKRARTIATYLAREFYARLDEDTEILVIDANGRSVPAERGLLPRGPSILKRRIPGRFGEMRVEVYLKGEGGVVLYRRGSHIMRVSEIEELADTVWADPDISGEVVFDSLNLTADKKAPVRDEVFYWMISQLSELGRELSETLEEIRSTERRAKKVRLIRDLARKISSVLRQMEQEPPKLAISSGSGGTEASGELQGSAVGRVGTRSPERRTGKTPVSPGGGSRRARYGRGIAFEEEDFGVPFPRSRFDREVGVIRVNTRHSDYVDRVLNRGDERYWVDYFYKLTIKELLADRLGVDGVEDELEWLVDFALRMEEEPPKLGVISPPRRRRSRGARRKVAAKPGGA